MSTNKTNIFNCGNCNDTYDLQTSSRKLIRMKDKGERMQTQDLEQELKQEPKQEQETKKKEVKVETERRMEEENACLLEVESFESKAENVIQKNDLFYFPGSFISCWMMQN